MKVDDISGHFWRQDLADLIVVYIHKVRDNRTSLHVGPRKPETEGEILKSQKSWKKNGS